MFSLTVFLFSEICIFISCLYHNLSYAQLHHPTSRDNNYTYERMEVKQLWYLKLVQEIKLQVDVRIQTYKESATKDLHSPVMALIGYKNCWSLRRQKIHHLRCRVLCKNYKCEALKDLQQFKQRKHFGCTSVRGGRQHRCGVCAVGRW